MKHKNLIVLCLISFLSLSLIIKNKNTLNNEVINNTIHYHNEQVIKKANNINPESKNFIRDDNIDTFLQKKYSNNESINWSYKSTTVADMTHEDPVNMQSDDFPTSIIHDALDQLPKLESSYGGCGPIATMGILHYFAKSFDYLNIPYLQRDDKQLMAKYILENTKTWEVKDGTFSFPWSCVNGFNKTLVNYGTENRLVADWYLNTDADEMTTIIKNRIDKGLPVSFYQVFADDSYFNDHYINIYGYKEYEGRTASGKIINQTLFKVHLNWEQGRYEDFFDYVIPKYMDEDVLKLGINGIVYYDLKYNEKELVSHDFKDFVNENNQGQYFNEEKTQTIHYLDDFSFETKRLRCSYIENEYLVLSTIKKNGVYVENERQSAYLEFQFAEPIRKFEYDISMWSTKENFLLDTTGELQYYSNSDNMWITLDSYNMVLLPTKDNPKHYFQYLSLEENIYKIRFIMSHPKVNADRNKGRIVLDNLDFCFDNHNISQSVHTHKYKYSFENKDDEYHKAYCKCGDFILEKHSVHYDESGNELCSFCGSFKEHEHSLKYQKYDIAKHMTYCEHCDYVIYENHIPDRNIDSNHHMIAYCTKCSERLTYHSYTQSYDSVDEQNHKAYCECGEYVLEEHSYTYETIDGNTHRYYCICGDSHIESHTIDTSNHIHGTFHCNKCDETIEIAHNFTYGYESNGENGHIAYCECGESITEEHTFITQNGKTICQYCNYEQPHIHQYVYEEYNEIRHQKSCECGESIMEEHIVDCFDCDYEDEDYHTLHCICGHTIYQEHDYSYMYIITDEYHKILCGCFDYILVPHDYSDKYEVSNDEYHKAYCSCQRYILVPHYYEEGSNICMYCGYQQEHIHQYTYDKFDNERHIGDCSCGDTIYEFHDAGEISTGHGATQCIYCGTEMLILHVFQDHYEQYDENDHKAYCICGDVIYVPHTYNEDGVCIYCNHENN